MFLLLSRVKQVREIAYIADEASRRDKPGELRSPRRWVASRRMVESLVVRRRLVAERRVDPAGVVEAFDEVNDFPPCLRGGWEAASVEEFALQSREEALAHRVV